MEKNLPLVNACERDSWQAKLPPMLRCSGLVRRASFRTQQGLTLVEIMVVLIILTVLGVFLLSKVTGGGDQAKARITRLSINRLAQEIEVFRLEYNSLPQSLDELAKGSDRLGPDYIPLVSEDDVKDGWGNPFQYELTDGGRRYRITSFGADGQPGGTGVNFDIYGTGP